MASFIKIQAELFEISSIQTQRQTKLQTNSTAQLPGI